ncbi:amino acid synthesis family protein [Leucobacter tenebrionis]|uniref:amino acid synthesis family protein n=1 Tax=Leucobacter tenebrionis TaxID=2873270 RepID=UPI001CA6D9EE|nr:amino acid synthesis family protein [Leucobacter tenebrionis]QZY51023.1 amino acid synthesis family protein [Leucobacter tenebrionis]
MPPIPTAEARTVDLSSRSTLVDYADVAAAAGLRRVSTQVEEVPREHAEPIRRAAAIAVIRNPWLGTGTDTDLAPETRRVAPLLAKLLTDRLLDALGGADRIEAFGKAALVGTAGELEHAGALVHTPYFGNLVREALEGTSIICFVDGRAEPGELLRVPLWHKTAAATRSHYQTVEVNLVDAPHAGEIAVVATASTGPRPFARIGDRTTDQPVTSEILKEIEL